MEGNPIGQFYASASSKSSATYALASLPNCCIIMVVLNILLEFDYKDCINQIWAQVKCVTESYRGGGSIPTMT